MMNFSSMVKKGFNSSKHMTGNICLSFSLSLCICIYIYIYMSNNTLMENKMAIPMNMYYK